MQRGDPDQATQLIAGPYALYAYHKNIVRAAAKDKSRYVLNAVGLQPEIPGLVATNGRILATLPIQPITEDGELGAFGAGFTSKGLGRPILLPLELFKGIPAKLDSAQSHFELVVVKRGGQHFAIRRAMPYGNTSEYHIPEELVDGQFPEYQQLLRDEVEDSSFKSKVAACFDAGYLADTARAIGAAEAVVKIMKKDGAAIVHHSSDPDRRAAGPKGWEGFGVIMPITLA
jgi:hypothetical protein